MARPVRLAHLSDPHLARPLPWAAANPKRILGRLNWLLRRSRCHQPARFARAVDVLLAAAPDVVLVTGDLGQTGLAEEIDEARKQLERFSAQGVPVLLVSGNHEHYGRDSASHEAFARAREALRLERRPDACGIVRLGGIEIVLLDQGRPTSVFEAWGEVSDDVRRCLSERFATDSRPEAGRVAAGHYPFGLPSGRPIPRPYALRGADELRALLQKGGVRAYFCGHLHQAFTRQLFAGCTQYCAGSVTAAGRPRCFACGPDGVEELALPAAAP